MTATVPVVAPRCPRHRPMQPKNCHRCRLYQASKDSARNAAVRAGTWERMVDPTPAADHCRALHAAGMSYSRQATVAGVGHRHIRDIVAGRVRRLQPTTAEALLSLTPPPPGEATGWRNLVDACGTRRRIAGMAVNGFNQTDVGRRLGVTGQAVSSWCTVSTVTRASAAKVKALADELYGLTGPAPEWTCRKLARRGWVPLEAWADDIDDPAAVPNIPDMSTYVDEVKVLRAVRGEVADADLTKAERTAAVTVLAGRGMADRDIAIRLQWVGRNGRPTEGAVAAWRNARGIDAGRNRTGDRTDGRYDAAKVAAAVRGEVRARELGPLEKVAAVRTLVDQGLRDRGIAERLDWGPDLARAESSVQTFRNKHRIKPVRSPGSTARWDSQPARVDLTAVA